MDKNMMVVLIVLIVMIAGVMRAKYSGQHRRRDGEEEPGRSPAEVRRMEEDMKALKDRVAVLERIATDRTHLLEQEFDRLRDR